MARRVRLSRAEARRIALAAAGLDRARPAFADKRHFRRVLHTLQLLQLDFVNVLVPAHELVVWSRLGPYDRNALHRYLYHSGEATEHWAHEASIVPVAHRPLLRYRRDRYQPWKNAPINQLDDREAYLDAVIAAVGKHGPLTATELPARPRPHIKPDDWFKSVPRSALEYHFGRGDVAVVNRLPGFQRVYDLAERVFDAAQLDVSIDAAEGHVGLLRNAAEALGVFSREDLFDYYRMAPADADPALQRLLRDGDVHEVGVAGWDRPGYMARRARVPRRIGGASLLSPFDPVTWCRPRLERLFDFEYRIEIYVPAARRRWGYYVLPFRVGDSIEARVDLKADRDGGRLLVRRSWLEDGADAAATASRLAAELDQLRDWLGLDDVVVQRHNTFSRTLAAIV